MGKYPDTCRFCMGCRFLVYSFFFYLYSLWIRTVEFYLIFPLSKHHFQSLNHVCVCWEVCRYPPNSSHQCPFHLVSCCILVPLLCLIMVPFGSLLRRVWISYSFRYVFFKKLIAWTCISLCNQVYNRLTFYSHGSQING